MLTKKSKKFWLFICCCRISQIYICSANLFNTILIDWIINEFCFIRSISFSNNAKDMKINLKQHYTISSILNHIRVSSILLKICDYEKYSNGMKIILSFHAVCMVCVLTSANQLWRMHAWNEIFNWTEDEYDVLIFITRNFFIGIFFLFLFFRLLIMKVIVESWQHIS